MSAFDFDVVTGPAIPLAPRQAVPEAAPAARATPRPLTMRGDSPVPAPLPVGRAADLPPSR